MEQRIARAWRKGQTRSVTVINLVAENTIEHGMLGSLAHKAKLADGILDGGETKGIELKGGGRSVLKRLEQILLNTPAAKPAPVAPPTDPSIVFALKLREMLGERLVQCEEIWNGNSDTPVLFAVLQSGATEFRPRIEDVHRSIPHAEGLVPLQVLDKSAYDSLRVLAEAGVITTNTRATRPLLPEDGKRPLTAEELTEVARLRETAAKKRKAATALEAAGLADEATEFACAAEDAESKAAAILSQKHS